MAGQGQSPACFLASAAVTGQNIPAGESDPAQGQPRRAATLLISQVRKHETENLNNMPKATLGGQGSAWPPQVTAQPMKWVFAMCPLTRVHLAGDSLQPQQTPLRAHTALLQHHG